MILSLIFPSFCIHCKEKIEYSQQGFCKNCIHFLVLSNHFEKNVVTFEENFIAQSFLCFLRQNHFPSFIKTAASFMVLKFLQLGWEIPDKIFTVKDSFHHKLAKYFSCFFDGRHIPIIRSKRKIKRLQKTQNSSNSLVILFEKKEQKKMLDSLKDFPTISLF